MVDPTQFVSGLSPVQGKTGRWGRLRDAANWRTGGFTRGSPTGCPEIRRAVLEARDRGPSGTRGESRSGGEAAGQRRQFGQDRIFKRNRKP